MLFTGMRIGEILAIKLDDIDENYLYVSQTMTRDENDKTILGTKTKTSKSKRPIAINTTIKQILDSSLSEHIKNKQNLLFCDRNTKGIIKPYEVNSYLSRLNKKNSIANNLHNHMLRHTYGSILLQNGVDIQTVAELMGHTAIGITQIYMHSTKELKTKEVNKLNFILKT